MDRKQQSGLAAADPQQSGRLSSSDLTVVPFVPIDDGEWILPDSFLVSIWDQMEREDLVDRVFWDQSVSGNIAFIRMCKKPENQLAFMFSGKTPVGFAWLSGVSGNFAFGHFCLFKNSWGRITEDIGEKYLDYWFSWEGPDGPLIETIIGMVPGFNTPAHAFVQRIGFHKLGVIPRMLRNKQGERQDAHIFYIQR